MADQMVGYRAVTAWRQAIESLLSLGRRLTDAEWAAPTECPLWTVKDIYSHLVGGERWMAAGHPVPEDYPAWAAGPVAARRDAAPPVILAELRYVYEQRRYQLSREPVDPDRAVHQVTGEPTTFGTLLRTRALDVWVHEQDVRRAVGQPGNLASPGAAVAGELFVAALPRIVAKPAEAPSGSLFRLTTSGEVAVDVAVAVDREGRGELVAPGRPPLAHTTLGWEAYTRLSAGRGTPGDYDIRIGGDRALAERVLAHLSTCP